MKISDVCLALVNGSVMICRKNSRGHPKPDGIDVTSDFLNILFETHKHKPEEHVIRKREDGYYKMKITKMTDEEVAEMLEEKKKMKEKNERDFAAINCFTYYNTYFHKMPNIWGIK